MLVSLVNLQLDTAIVFNFGCCHFEGDERNNRYRKEALSEVIAKRSRDEVGRERDGEPVYR